MFPKAVYMGDAIDGGTVTYYTFLLHLPITSSYHIFLSHLPINPALVRPFWPIFNFLLFDPFDLS